MSVTRQQPKPGDYYQTICIRKEVGHCLRIGKLVEIFAEVHLGFKNELDLRVLPIVDGQVTNYKLVIVGSRIPDKLFDAAQAIAFGFEKGTEWRSNA